MKKIALEEAFRLGLVKKGDYVDYQLISARCTFDESQTGWKEVQSFSTEKLGWQIDEFEGKLILLADQPTKQELTLRGKIGYEKGVEAQHELCRKLYTNSSLVYNVISITLEIKNSTNVPSREFYWLASSFMKKIDKDYFRFGVHRGMGDGVYVDGLWYSSGYFCSHSSKMRPVVFLRSDIQVVNLELGDGSRNKPWRVVNASESKVLEQEK